MPVIVEKFTVLIDRFVIDDESPGRVAELVTEAPNNTLCGDGFLIRVVFSDLGEAHRYLLSLADLTYGDGTPSAGLAIQGRGLVTQGPSVLIEEKCLEPSGGPMVTVARHSMCEADQLSKFDRFSVEARTMPLDEQLVGAGEVQFFSLPDLTAIVVPGDWDFQGPFATDEFPFDEESMQDYFVQTDVVSGKPIYRPLDSIDFETSLGQSDSPKVAEAASWDKDHSKAKQEACKAVAKMFNELRFEHVESLLHDGVRLVFQESGETVLGAPDVEMLLRRWLLKMLVNQSRFWAELGWTDKFDAGPVVVLGVDTKKNMPHTILLQLTDGKISGIEVCVDPSVNDCKRTGEYPVRTWRDIAARLSPHFFGKGKLG